MAGPWEQYAQPDADGPWKDYAQEEPQAGFNERFGSFEPVPEAFQDRLKAGAILKQQGWNGDIGGALPEAHADFWKTFEGSQLANALKFFTLPGRVMSGETKLTTEEGMNEAVGMGVGLALQRMNELPGGAGGRGGPLIKNENGIITRPNGQAVGDLPRDADFSNAAKVLNAPEANLRRAWQEDGIHPAEAVHDAEQDAFFKHQISEEPVKASLSAAVTPPKDLPPLVSPDVQPLSAPGKIVADMRALRDQMFDTAGWVQSAIAPISRGPDAMIRYTAEYLSELRRIQWDMDRWDKDLTTKFSPMEREDIWRAMDEESVLAQKGETSTDTGLATLEPRLRAAADEGVEHAITTRLAMMSRGMVEDEGLPHYVPRLFSGIEKGSYSDIGSVSRFMEKTGTMKQRKYLTAEESEAAAKAKYGDKVSLVRDIRTLPIALKAQQRAIATHDLIEGVRKFGQDIGDPQIGYGTIPAGQEKNWFTLPFTDFKTLNEKGVSEPMHIKAEWANMFKAIDDTRFNDWDKVIMEVKNRPMTMIMNSPFLHLSVVYSKALPSNPGNMLTGRFLRMGPQLLNDPKFMTDMTRGGMVLWGRRPGFKQDISSVMEDPTLQLGRSLTAQALAYIPDLFSEKAGTAVKTGIDKLGEIVHDKILGETVQKIQASLAYDFRQTLRTKFPHIPDETLNILAAHEGNRFGGSLPSEAMSAFARGITNALFFSRQFTFGNLGILKDAVKGPPEYVMARVRDMMGREGADQATQLKNYMRRHALGVVVADVAMYYGVNAFLQSAIDVATGTPMPDEAAGYWWRLKAAANRVMENPTSPSSYLSFLPSLSPTFYHEPGKEGKVLLGRRADGTAIYGRSVIGRMGEDYTGLAINPALWFLNKMAPIPRAMMELIENRDSFGRPILDPHPYTDGKLIETGIAIAKHLIEANLPMQQIQGAANLAKGTGDYKDAISTFGPYAPPPLTITASQGYPGGPVAGTVAAKQRDLRAQQDLAMAEIKSMVVDKGDVNGARQRMKEFGMTTGLSNFLIRNWLHPGQSKTTTRALTQFYNHASSIERDIMNYQRNGMQ